MRELIEDRSLIVPITEPVTPEQRKSAFDLFGKFGRSVRQIQEHFGFERRATVETIIWEEFQARERKRVNLALQRGRLLAMPNLPDPGAPGIKPGAVRGRVVLVGKMAA